jgi:hypothetical protein
MRKRAFEWVAYSAVLMLLLAGHHVFAAGTPESEPILSVKRHGNCAGCPAYEIKFFADGTSLYTGGSLMRRDGEGGSRLRVKGFGVQNPVYVKAFAHSVWWLTFNQEKLQSLLSEIAQRDSFTRFRQDGVPASFCFQRRAPVAQVTNLPVTTIRARYKNFDDSVSFCESASAPLELMRLAAQIESLYEYPLDLLREGSFAESKAKARIAVTWDRGSYSNLMCGRDGENFDAVLVLNDDGTLAISGFSNVATAQISGYPTVLSSTHREKVLSLLDSLNSQSTELPRWSANMVPPISPEIASYPVVTVSVHVKNGNSSEKIFTTTAHSITGVRRSSPDLIETLISFIRDVLTVNMPQPNWVETVCREQPPGR